MNAVAQLHLFHRDVFAPRTSRARKGLDLYLQPPGMFEVDPCNPGK